MAKRKVRPEGESPEHRPPRAQPPDALETAHRAEEVRASLDAKDLSGAKSALNKTVSIVDKMATKGIIHRNTAGRYKSRLSSRLAKANA